MVGSVDGGGSFVKRHSRLAACCPSVAQVEHARHELAHPRRLCPLWREVAASIFVVARSIAASPCSSPVGSLARLLQIGALVLAISCAGASPVVAGYSGSSSLLRQLVARPSTSTSWLDPSPPGHRFLRAVPEPAGSSSSRASSWSTLSSKFSAAGSPSSHRR